MTKLRLVCASAVLAATASGNALADVTANVGFMSDYIFRGIYQSESTPFGGLDYTSDGDHFYLGTWGANVKDGLEYDLYGGYQGGGDVIQWHAGLTGYYYTDNFDRSYEEYNLGFNYGFLNVEYALGEYNGPVFDWQGIQVNRTPDGGAKPQTYEYWNWTFTPEVGPYYAVGHWNFHHMVDNGRGGKGGWYYELGKSFEVMEDLEMSVAAYFSNDTDAPGAMTIHPIVLGNNDPSADFAFSLTLTKMFHLSRN
jgi:hypothetical protein